MLCVSWNNFVKSGERVIVDILMFNFCSLYPFVLIPLIAIRKWNNMWERNISYHCIHFFFLGSTRPFPLFLKETY